MPAIAARAASRLRRLAAAAVVVLIFALLGQGQARAASPIKIHSPAPDATVSAMVTTSVRVKPQVARVAFLLDGAVMASSSSTNYVWDSTAVSNGTHTISAQAYSSSNQLLHTVSEKVRVSNKHNPSPTATPTPTVPAVSFVSPVSGQKLSGTITVALSFSAPPSTTNPNAVWWTHLSVDGAPIADGYNNTPWNTTTVANGSHNLRVDGYAYNGTTSIGSSTVSVTVNNTGATSTATATSTVTSSSTPRPTATPTGSSTSTTKPTATPTASSTPTAKPTATPTLALTPTPTSTSTPSGSTFYVSPTGSDSAAGSSSAPWRTIQKAAGTLKAGQTAIVSAGNYGERVSIANSGTLTAPITLQVASGADVKLLGFDLTGNNWVLSGFDISTQTNGSEGYGIHVYGSAAHDTIQNNYIHELCHEGIFMESGVSYISVLNDRIWAAEMAGVQVDGMHDLVQGTEVWGTQQYPVDAGGIYSGCTTSGGADADAFRFFGQHNVFRSNYAHDIATVLPANPNPHTDCFQTWGSTAMEVDDILIERNVCRWPLASTAVDSETAMIEGVDGLVGTVTLQNNELSNMRQGIVVGSNVGALHVYNNTWDHVLEEGIIFNDMRSSADEFINNIYYDVGAGGDSFAEVPSGSPVFEDNDFYMPGGGSLGTYPTVEPYISVAPMFVNYGDATGAGADLHLQAGSPLKGAGTTLTEVVNDYYGTSRVGAAYSIGAAQ
jgi:hypothetical protein